ncbi:uncharacterized protein LOC134182332 [Corticium candelabrum]|uniref:uncharacterized protein LOC134182332 n=1 Tax=Corticium candelabrum TaxID=121492 RepID=UPI002E26D455|nr:uncharacterized protein LOC134182332 [Corticium candelabrum]
MYGLQGSIGNRGVYLEMLILVVETPAASANCGNNSQLDRSQKRASKRVDVQFQTDPSLCIICQKEKRGRAKKDSKDRRRTEKLTTCTSLHGTLHNAATLRDDQRLLVYLVGGDDVAAEVKHHRSCYQQYTNRKDLEKLIDTEEEQSSPYETAFKNLLQEIQGPLRRGELLVTMPAMCNRFNRLLVEQGLSNPQYRTEKLKRRLRTHFAEEVVFYQTEELGKPCVLYSAHLPLIRVSELLQEVLDEATGTDTDDVTV